VCVGGGTDGEMGTDGEVIRRAEHSVEVKENWWTKNEKAFRQGLPIDYFPGPNSQLKTPASPQNPPASPKKTMARKDGEEGKGSDGSQGLMMWHCWRLGSARECGHGSKTPAQPNLRLRATLMPPTPNQEPF
jgi:hypothetical protein